MAEIKLLIEIPEELVKDDDDDDPDFLPSEDEFDFTDSDDDNTYNFDGENGEDNGDKIGEDDSDISSIDSDVSYDIDDSDQDVNVNESGKERKKSIDLTIGIHAKPFKPQPDGKIVFEVGNLFDNVHAFRAKLQDYSVSEGYNIEKKKNQKYTVCGTCAVTSCPWRIWASLAPDGVTFMVKTLNDKHKCVRAGKSVHANSTWIAQKLLDYLKEDPNMNYNLMREILKEKYQIEPKDKQLWRAKNKAAEWNEGSHLKSFGQLYRYVEALRRYDRNVVVLFKYEEMDENTDTRMFRQPVFKRFFVCFDAMKKGFIQGCRPFIGVDGCHLKGPFKGVLLAAIAIDGNKGIFPLAFAIVEGEDQYSWGWFLECLHTCIGTDIEDKPLTFMSDRQKGLEVVLHKIFPKASHRKCYRHIYANFRARFPGLKYRVLFWQAARAYNYLEFKEAMEEIKTVHPIVGPEAYEYLMDIPICSWTRHMFDPLVKCEHITNNMTESFNHWIGKFRSKPILTMCENIRLYNKHSEGMTWITKMTPKVRYRLDKVIGWANRLNLIPASYNEFQVIEGFIKRVVDLEKMTCSCGEWTISGIPCKHVAACMSHRRGNLEDFCDSYFSAENYLITYAGVIPPMAEEYWNPQEGDVVIQPPLIKRQAGIPKVDRRREKDEAPKNSMKVRSSTVKCSTCKQFGHNSRSCPIKKRQLGSTSSQGTSGGEGSSGPIVFACDGGSIGTKAVANAKSSTKKAKNGGKWNQASKN